MRLPSGAVYSQTQFGAPPPLPPLLVVDPPELELQEAELDARELLETEPEVEVVDEVVEVDEPED